jgi:hypothetical protein
MPGACFAAQDPTIIPYSRCVESGQIELSYLARIMGTSGGELEDTYFRWL